MKAQNYVLLMNGLVIQRLRLCTPQGTSSLDPFLLLPAGRSPPLDKSENFRIIVGMEQQIFLNELHISPKTCAFTGHRDLDDDFSVKKLRKEIKNAAEKGVEIFYSGMAMGFDLIAAEEVLKIKKSYPDVKIVACIPFYQQEKSFPEQDKKRYAKILKKADEIVYVSEHYFNGCMQKRDRYMADRADMLITYCKKQTGGTAYTVNYFQKKYKGREIVFL